MRERRRHSKITRASGVLLAAGAIGSASTLAHAAAPTAAPTPIPGVVTSFGTGGSLVIDSPKPAVVTAGVTGAIGAVAFGSVDGHLAAASLVTTPGSGDAVDVATTDVPGMALDVNQRGSARVLGGYVGQGVARRAVVIQTVDHAPNPEFGDRGTVELPLPGPAQVTTLLHAFDDDTVAAGTTIVDGEPTAFIAELRADGSLQPDFVNGGIQVVDLGPGADQVDSLVGVQGAVYLIGRVAGGVPVVAPFGDTYSGSVRVLDVPPGGTVTAAVRWQRELFFGGMTASHQPYVTALATPGFGTDGTVVLPGSGEVQALYTPGETAPLSVAIVNPASGSTEVRLASLGTSGAIAAPDAAPAGVLNVRPGAKVLALNSVQGGSLEVISQDPHGFQDAGFGPAPPGGSAIVDLYLPWGGPTRDLAGAIAPRRDGSLLVSQGNQYGIWLTALSSNGAVDARFGSSGSVRVPLPGELRAIREVADGSIMVATSSWVFRLHADGSRDLSYGDGGSARTPGDGDPETLVIDADGSVAGIADYHVRRLTPSGESDTTFGILGPYLGTNLGGLKPFHMFRRVDGRLVVLGLARGTLYRLVLDAHGFDTGSSEDDTRLLDRAGASILSAYHAAIAADGDLVVVGNATTGRSVHLWRFDKVTDALVRHVELPTEVAAANLTAAPDGSFMLTLTTARGASITKLRADLSIERGFGVNGSVATGYAYGWLLDGTALYVGTTEASGSSWNAEFRKLSTSVPSPGAPGRYVALAAPVRIYDSRNVAALKPNVPVSIPGTGAHGLPVGAIALATNLTIVGAPAGAWAQIYGTGLQFPGIASNVNVTSGGSAFATFAAVRPGVGGAISVVSSAAAHAVVDVFGYWLPASSATAGRFTAVAPARLLDSRLPGYGGRPLATGEVRTVATGRRGASAAVVNLTVTGSAGGGWLAGFASGRTTTSNLNFRRGETRANLAIVPLLPDGTFRITASTPTHVIVDLLGVMTGASAPNSAVGLFVSETATRRVDTRVGLEGGVLKPGGSAQYQIAGDGGVPDSARTALVNVVATGTLARGYVSIRDDLTAPNPGTSTLNVGGAGQTVSNAAIATLRAGHMALYDSAGGHLVVDVSGWFTG